MCLTGSRMISSHTERLQMTGVRNSSESVRNRCCICCRHAFNTQFKENMKLQTFVCHKSQENLVIDHNTFWQQSNKDKLELFRALPFMLEDNPNFDNTFNNVLPLTNY